MAEGYADLVFYLLEVEQDVLDYDQNAAGDYYALQGAPMIPDQLRFTALLEVGPPEVHALLHQEYLLDLKAHEEVAGEGEDFDEPLLSEFVVASFCEDKQGDGG